ncbi:GreA/GreB family elongation factor [Pelotalea chapellei]|uniref:GreA/GreB family elongation factor n=1 Tax=Pelotalea chapellei TaxID=44671 RepID=A0ABS5U3Q0_9BACT|nr:GreA/GreB family elongation factor [Pelotalea chapellei]MBT1070295.1 GreA/GreB family elongation factor [Pelotalea chapellei]
MNKPFIFKLIIEQLETDLALLHNAAKTAHEASIHEENIPDNKYDTLSLEASYVAQGQANRAQEIKEALDTYKLLELQTFQDDTPIRLTALVSMEAEDGATRLVFIGPLEGGMKVSDGNREIIVITPGSPIGSALIGRTIGETVEIGSGASRKEFEIIEVC